MYFCAIKQLCIKSQGSLFISKKWFCVIDSPCQNVHLPKYIKCILIVGRSPMQKGEKAKNLGKLFEFRPQDREII